MANYKIRLPRPAGSTRPSTPKIDRVTGDPILTGQVNGVKASAPEEILAKALEKRHREFAFRYKIPAVAGTYGLRGEKEVDFILTDGVLKPIQVADFEFVHRTPQQQEEDAQSDIIVNGYFKEYGAAPVVWIDANDLKNVDMADLTIRKMGLV